MTRAIAVSVAHGLVRSRAARSRSLPFDIFSDPAWDILIDLFIADATGRRLSITDVCSVGGISATTGQRYIARMVSLKLLIRVDDPGDRRRTLLELVPLTRDTLSALFVEMAGMTEPHKAGALEASPASAPLGSNGASSAFVRR